MKQTVFILLLTMVLLTGCGYTTRIYFPSGYTQADYERDQAECKNYTRTWCAQYGEITITGQREGSVLDRQSTVGVSGRRQCDGLQFKNIYQDCMKMKGYRFVIEKR